MDFWTLALFSGLVVAATLAFIWLALSMRRMNDRPENRIDIVNEASKQAESVFNKEFREELKNRGRLHFENVINENAMFLQQDLRLTTSQLNSFMQDEIKRVLKEEFSKYEETINTSKEQAVAAIAKTQTVMEEQRELLSQQLTQEFTKAKADALAKLQNRMGEILNHYLLEAIGNEIDVSDQIEYIMSHLEENRQAIIEDIKSGT